MEFYDLALDGKPLRIWNQQGSGQVAANHRQPLHTRYDAEQWVQRIQHQAPEHILPLCTLAGLTLPDNDGLINALHQGQLIVSMGHATGGKSMGNAKAGQQWRAKQAEPAPLISAAMQNALAALGTETASLLRPAQGSQQNASTMASGSADKPGKNASPEQQKTWHCLIEIAGRNHFSTQQLGIKNQPGNAAPARNDRQQPHRALIDLNTKDNQPVTLQLNIATHTGQPLTLPLPQPVTPRQKTAAPAGELDTVIIPVRPIQYRNLQDNPQQANLPHSGFAYVFWQGKLWRELAADPQGVLRDIDVSWERQQRLLANPGNAPQPRSIIGKNLDAIWIPAKLNGDWQTGSNGFELAFFPQPLSWEDIDKLESDATQRQRYATALDGLQQYGSQQAFSGHTGHIGALQSAVPPLTDDNDPDAQIQNQQHQTLTPYRNNGFAAAYLQPTVKRVAIHLEDAYQGALKTRQFNDGDNVILKGNKEYPALVRQNRIVCDIDIHETSLTLELVNNCHAKASEPA